MDWLTLKPRDKLTDGGTNWIINQQTETSKCWKSVDPEYFASLKSTGLQTKIDKRMNEYTDFKNGWGSRIIMLEI